jgi:hypothetical protein
MLRTGADWRSVSLNSVPASVPAPNARRTSSAEVNRV